MQLERSKGTRDFLPEEQIVRQEIVGRLKAVFELYGYPPLETPVLERFDVMASKYAGGAEILKETFKLADQGGRELALRYDLTVPFARIIGMNPQLKMPFKRYHVGEVFRDGPMGLGRYRQFTQCDVDIAGCKEVTAEAELLSLAEKVFDALGLEIKIKINNRKLLNDILTKFKIKKHEEVILSVDKLAKIGVAGVKKELEDKGVSEDQIDELLYSVSYKGTNEEKIAYFKGIVQSDGIKELEDLLNYLKIIGVEAEFEAALARGLSYYTGTVIEIFMKKSKIESSVCAGGRYDKMIGEFLGKGDYPAVGISFGLDRIHDAYTEMNKAGAKTVAQVYVIPIKTFAQSLKIAEQLRANGIRTDVDLSGRGPSKNLQYANSLGIPFVAIIGEEELREKKVKLKNMQSGEEKLLGIDDCVKAIKA
ncbi:MAG: histidine--tRNA ligase [Candidatus Woesearchaeota archaeon]